MSIQAASLTVPQMVQEFDRIASLVAEATVPSSTKPLPLPDYYVVMLDLGRLGREAVVDPEVTRREVVSRIASGEYARDELLFVQHVVQGSIPRDVTIELIEDAMQINAREAA